MFRKSFALAALVALVALGSQPSARADGFMAYKPFSGKIEFLHADDHLVVKNNPRIPGKGSGSQAKPATINVAAPMNEAWDVLRPQIEKGFPKFLGKEYVKGVSAYDVKTDLAKKGTLECWVYNDQLSIRYTLSGNSVAASLTTPDAEVGPFKIGVGKYADPRVSLTFDVQITIGIKFQLHGAPVINEAKGVFLNAKLKPQNFSGDVLNGANELVKFVGGPDFKAKAEGLLNGQGKDFSKSLADLLKSANPLVAAITHDAKTLTTKLVGQEVVVTYSDLPVKKQVIK